MITDIVIIRFVWSNWPCLIIVKKRCLREWTLFLPFLILLNLSIWFRIPLVCETLLRCKYRFSSIVLRSIPVVVIRCEENEINQLDSRIETDNIRCFILLSGLRNKNRRTNKQTKNQKTNRQAYRQTYKQTTDNRQTDKQTTARQTKDMGTDEKNIENLLSKFFQLFFLQLFWHGNNEQLNKIDIFTCVIVSTTWRRKTLEYTNGILAIA